MKLLKINNRINLRLFAALMFCLLIPQTVFSQTEKLGIVNYTPPRGMEKSARENIVAFSELDKATGKYCIITLYGATPGTGSPKGDFKREWNNLVVKTMKADANPKTEEQKDGEWTAVSGGSEVDSAELGKAVGFLTVISGSRTTVSVLAVFNDPACSTTAEQLIGSIEMDKASAPANNTAAAAPLTTAPTLDEDGALIIPLITRQLTMADLAGEWGEGDTRLATAYFSSSTGNYVGTDRVAFTSKNTITKNGGYSNDLFAIRNGKKERDITTGTISIDGRVLTIVTMNNDTKRNSTSSHVVYGWLDLPDMTIMKISINFWGREIPEQVFTNYDPKYTNAVTWIRKKK